jgi:hypothetical protein
VAVIVNPGPTALFAFATLPGGSTVSITKKQTAHFNVFLNGNGFEGTVGLTCAGAPPGFSCTVNPMSVDLRSTVTSVPLQVTVAPTGKVHVRGNQRNFTLVITGAEGPETNNIPLVLTVKP